MFAPTAEGVLTLTFKTAVPMTSSSAVEVYLTNNRAKLSVELVDSLGKVHALPASLFDASCKDHPWRALLRHSSLSASSRASQQERRKSPPTPGSFNMSVKPTFIRIVKIKFGYGAGVTKWSATSGPQVTGVRLLSSLQELQASCALQGPNTVWSVSKGACVSVATLSSRTCPKAQPVFALEKCFAVGICTSEKISRCRSICKWGASKAETMTTISIALSGISKEQLLALKAAFKAAVAGSIQVLASKVKVLAVETVNTKLKVRTPL